MNVEASYSLQRTRKAPEDEYPLAEVSLGLLLHVKSHAPMPPSAMARLALRELRRMAGEVEVRNLKPAGGKANQAEAEPVVEVQISLKEKAPPVGAPADFSGLDKRIVNTAFRILDLVAKEDAAGGEALVSDLTHEVSAPTVARFLDATTPPGQAVAGWFRIEKRGRTKAIFLTQEGRRLAHTRLTIVAKA